jgi:hypothetical protein
LSSNQRRKPLTQPSALCSTTFTAPETAFEHTMPRVPRERAARTGTPAHRGSLTFAVPPAAVARGVHGRVRHEHGTD